MKPFLRFFVCSSFVFGAVAANVFLPASAKSSNLGPAPAASSIEKKGSSAKNSGSGSKDTNRNTKNSTSSDASSNGKGDQSKAASTNITDPDQSGKSSKVKESGTIDQNGKNNGKDSLGTSAKNSAPGSKSGVNKSAQKNGLKVKPSNTSKGALKAGTKTGEAKLEDEDAAPESWSVENRAEEPVSSEGNFSAIQNSSAEDKSSDNSKWLFYSGVGLIVFSIIGLAFFTLFLFKNNRKLRSNVDSGPDEDDDY